MKKRRTKTSIRVSLGWYDTMWCASFQNSILGASAQCSCRFYVNIANSI